jgi:hypothetical protein
LGSLLITHQTFGEESMHIIELYDVSKFLLFFCHPIAQCHILYHIIGEHPVCNLAYWISYVLLEAICDQRYDYLTEDLLGGKDAGGEHQNGAGIVS